VHSPTPSAILSGQALESSIRYTFVKFSSNFNLRPSGEVVSNWTNVGIVDHTAGTNAVDSTTGTKLQTTAGGDFMSMPFPTGVRMERKSTYVLHVKAANRASLMTEAGRCRCPQYDPNSPNITQYHPMSPNITPKHHLMVLYRISPSFTKFSPNLT